MSAAETKDAKDAKGLQITIMGRNFRVACKDEEQAALLEAVDYLNRRMEEIRDQGKIVGLERIAIMAALNITHEYLGAKNDSYGNGDRSGNVRTNKIVLKLIRRYRSEIPLRCSLRP